MKIALDYDDTYTSNFVLWSQIVRLLKSHGCDVRFVTARVDYGIGYNGDIRASAIGLDIPIIYCDHKSKESVCKSIGWVPDIWIDDTPIGIPSRETIRMWLLDFIE